ncbi:mercuric reductase [uncultured Sphaerochaeta sp.]|uniref:mercuric reductase n=1 Tax=uncultured Sphaerochaeta sp. TaxID=886478 RepID=UPI0029CA3845|nr:mercuric reductase [uncultured Sphaerochaeta sp.]
MKRYDVIIIGTGQATGTILGELLKQNQSIAVVESDRVGGSCVNWGCTPTKTFIASARAAHMIHRGSEFGIEVASYQTNFPKVMKRVNAIRDEANKGFTEWLEQTVDFYPGLGSFIDSHTVEIEGTRIHGEKIVIHTGTRARIPDIPGIDAVPWLDNKGILALGELPSHLLIIGGSYIGLEFAQAFRRLGSKVTIFESSTHIISREDEDISLIARTILEDEGIEILTSASISSISKEADQSISVHYQGETITGSHLLVGIGRVPNSDSLNLRSAGIVMDERGFITVDDECRTSVPHIFALGDVNGKGAFTHTSVHDGQVFLSVLSGGSKKISDRIPTYSLFIDPPLARVGLSEKEAKKLKIPYLVATKEMATISRAKEKDETKGRIKILVHKTNDTIIGAAVFGVGGDEVIGMIALAMQAGLRYQTIQDTVIPHPTVAELIPWVFSSLQSEA